MELFIVIKKLKMAAIIFAFFVVPENILAIWFGSHLNFKKTNYGNVAAKLCDVINF